ncbi:alpha/beta-hydrolase [Punctularia strigosozonata HHB-11173 SS5]|uniref:alpha/beta-hydrolase n=1 Tax=Punctularia strigosozonata (strain HHB-11173) TaxID=741275 RepID=UPI000441815C|nr:alpha/beta-hydrolase [Punctularia strigosozonata HHB-11173 SS5]EIN09963.1 alpha/beta-hydrolase [Punctularia strigosozonata HHB-11173 SS5]
MRLSPAFSFISSIAASLPWHETSNSESVPQPGGRPSLRFGLRHEHAVSPSGHVSFSDISRSPDLYALRAHSVKRQRLHYFNAEQYLLARRSRLHVTSKDNPWEEDEIIGPDVESRETLLLLAKMTNNAYLNPGETGWYDLGEGWSADYPIGWEPDDDGFRGHVFATPDNSTIVVSIKGTSAGWLGGGGSTTKKDKLNDNLLFSCCCAYIDFTWTPVCDCYRGGWKCDQNCLEKALIDDSLFYPIGTNLYNNITYLYPDSNIWLTGHSLGGALASLLGATFGMPVVTFEAPGEKRAARRLHLPIAPSMHHITHVYHTADPIAMGTCNGIVSSCAIAGYAMESRCHLGKTIVYDTVSNLSWSANIRTHGIVRVIEDVLGKPWKDAEERGREVPEPKEDAEDCEETECYSWDFGDYPPKKKSEEEPELGRGRCGP